MSISRRQFLAGATALSLVGVVGRRSEAATLTVLRAAPGTARLAPMEYSETPIWGYNGGTPGPILRVRQGERVVRRFANELPQPSTVHWHGIRIANAMDGVPDLTQPAVPAGKDFVYDFVAPDAGTYWYHPHNKTWEQMARGLYGALIVEESSPPFVDRDEVLLIDDWRLTDDARIAENFGAMMDWSHAGRLGNWATVNGDEDFHISVKHRERMRLRLVNTANARIFSLEIKGVEAWVVALDGQPLDAPMPAGRLTLAPAQRVDLIVDFLGDHGSRASLVSFERDGSYALADFDVLGKAREDALPPPLPLPANPLSILGDLAKARRIDLRMEGGAMGAMRGAMMGGQMTGMRDLVQAGRVWAFNGLAEMPDVPLVAASAGETLRIAMINDTAWPHGMHLHGHHFRKIESDGKTGPLRDTILVDRNEVAEIAFVADNPGDWLLHCHMLEHSAGGMMTWIRVT
jgi:FtsP/CotA-like multicopper oxidase with cupredoxin domain